MFKRASASSIILALQYTISKLLYSKLHLVVNSPIMAMQNNWLCIITSVSSSSYCFFFLILFSSSFSLCAFSEYLRTPSKVPANHTIVLMGVKTVKTHLPAVYSELAALGDDGVLIRTLDSQKTLVLTGEYNEPIHHVSVLWLLIAFIYSIIAPSFIGKRTRRQSRVSSWPLWVMMMTLNTDE